MVILWQELDFTLIISPSHRLLTSLMLFQDFKMLTFYVFKSTVFSFFYSATAASITHSKQIPQLWTNFVICVEDFNCTFKGCWCDDASCLRKLWWWFFETSSLSFLEYCAGRLVRWNKKVEAHRGSGNMISQSPLAASTHLTDTDRKTGMHHHHHHQHHHLPHHHHQYHHCHSRYRHIAIIITVNTTGGTERQWP